MPLLDAARRLLSIRATGVLTVVAVAYWWAVFLSMHIVQPELSTVEAPGSAYVLGRYGSWMTTTYFVLAAALIGARFGLSASIAVTTVTRLAGLALLIAAAGAVVAGIFPMDYPPSPTTTSGRLHAVAGAFTFMPWVIGTFLYTLSVRRAHDWSRPAGALITLAVLIVSTAVVLPVSIRLGYAGAVQRVLIALLFTWLTVAALHLMRADSAKRPPR